jgi:hypothetical protein
VTAPPADWLAAAFGTARRVLCVVRTPSPAIVDALNDATGVRAAGSAAGDREIDVASGDGLALLDGRGRYDAALVLDWLEHVTARDGRHVLARLRDLHAPRVTAIVDATRLDGWSDADWRALEFQPDGEAGPLRRYAYDIVTYNPPREWNQPTHWANPRNFDRFRW